MFARDSSYRMSLPDVEPCCAAEVPHVTAFPPYGLHPAGRTGTRVMCTPCRYCYHRELSSYRGRVRPCVHPVATMCARDRCSTVVGYVVCCNCYLRGLCFHRGHVCPCVYPVKTAITVSNVRNGVMFTRIYTLSLLIARAMFSSVSCSPGIAAILS